MRKTGKCGKTGRMNWGGKKKTKGGGPFKRTLREGRDATTYCSAGPLLGRKKKKKVKPGPSLRGHYGLKNEGGTSGMHTIGLAR